MAEDNKNLETQNQESNKPEENQNGGDKGNQPEVTMESMIAEMAKLKAENAKNKAALDKALHNNGELTKQLRAKMTASEQEEEAKREAEEAQKKLIKDLQDYKLKSEARERYMTTIGMSADLAKQAAEAEVTGDMEALSGVYKQHQSQQVALRQNGGGYVDRQVFHAVGHGHGCAAGLKAVDAAVFHQLLQFGGDALAQQFPAAAPRHGDDGVPVGDGAELAGAAVHGVAQLGGEVLHAVHQGVFLEDDLPVPVGINFQRVSLPDTHGTTDLFWDHHPPQIVDSADNARCFHI